MLKQLRETVKVEIELEAKKPHGRSKSLLEHARSRDSVLRRRPDSQASKSRMKLENGLFSPSKNMIRGESRELQSPEAFKMAISPS